VRERLDERDAEEKRDVRERLDERDVEENRCEREAGWEGCREEMWERGWKRGM
jgi:hypothetical protein